MELEEALRILNRIDPITKSIPLVEVDGKVYDLNDIENELKKNPSFFAKVRDFLERIISK